VLRAWGVSPPRSPHYLIPLSGRPTQNTLTDGSPRKGTIAPGENHPSEAPKHPRDTLSSSHSTQRRDRDGVVVADGGTSGAAARFPPVWVWVGWAGKAAAWDIAHPRQCPGHKRGRGRRVKRRTIVAVEVVAGLGVPRRALCSPVVPSGQAHAKHAHRWIPPERYQCPMREPPEQGPQTHPGFPHWRRGRHWWLDTGAGHPPTTITTSPPPPPPPPLDIIYMTLEIGSGQAGARDNVGGAYGGPSTGRRIRR